MGTRGRGLPVCALAHPRTGILSDNGRVLSSQPDLAAFIKGLCLPGWQTWCVCTGGTENQIRAFPATLIPTDEGNLGMASAAQAMCLAGTRRCPAEQGDKGTMLPLPATHRGTCFGMAGMAPRPHAGS